MRRGGAGHAPYVRACHVFCGAPPLVPDQQLERHFPAHRLQAVAGEFIVRGLWRRNDVAFDVAFAFEARLLRLGVDAAKIHLYVSDIGLMRQCQDLGGH